ncbi:MAG: hypothetical protein RMY34_36745 [Aulosira sp. DedQUE10]|nr:hypothetical protein [Aulosira sp. DedQUE10]
MDRRWQLVLDCIDCENAPFSQATLVRFRTALNWDDPDQKNLALEIVLDALERFETFVQAQPDKCSTSADSFSVGNRKAD